MIYRVPILGCILMWSANNVLWEWDGWEYEPTLGIMILKTYQDAKYLFFTFYHSLVQKELQHSVTLLDYVCLSIMPLLIGCGWKQINIMTMNLQFSCSAQWRIIYRKNCFTASVYIWDQFAIHNNVWKSSIRWFVPWFSV